MKITTDVPSSKLTPQRKHRKLLRSGEGEVWSEDVEKVFVQGLHHYWDSPWATYSRGRSRWRNQFLVDYLARAGIERTKKQVASHVQVLRNMWKGEKEYHLVAGGEELFLETGLLAPPVKQEEMCDMNVLSPADTDESQWDSPISPSTGGVASPQFEYSELLQMPPDNSQPGSPAGSADSVAAPRLNIVARGRSSSLPGLHRRYTAPTPSPLAPRPASSSFENQSPNNTSAAARAPPFMTTSYPPVVGPPTTAYGDQPRFYHGPSLVVPAEPCPHLPIRLSAISLFAEGMSPFEFSVDSVLSNHPSDQPAPRLIIQIKIRLPSIDDVHGFPTLHGVLGAVTFTRPWVTSTSCITDVYAASVHHSRENTALQPTSIDSCVTATLPESELTRCRWLDSSKETSIYQRIIADGETMAVIVYNLDRSSPSDNAPFAEVTGIQKYRVNSEKPTYNPPPPPSAASSDSSAYSGYSQPQCVIRPTRYPVQTSLSCALNPVGNMPSHYTPRSAVPTSMLL